MSRAIGLAALNLEPTPRLAHTEYCTHAALKRRVTGIREEGPAQERAFMDAWDYDLIWHTDDGPVDWSERGRTTDMGHAEFLEAGADRRASRPCPFRSVQEALAWMPWPVGAPTGDLVAYYQRAMIRPAPHTNQLHMGGYYKTLISGAIACSAGDAAGQRPIHGLCPGVGHDIHADAAPRRGLGADGDRVVHVPDDMV